MTMKTLLTALALGIGTLAAAQSYNDLAELARADIRAKKHAMVLANMEMTEEQSLAFAPVYDQYSAAMKTHWDKRVALVDEYFDAHGTMGEKTATAMLKRLDALEYEALNIRNAHEKKMLKVLPAPVVLRWVQVERRLGQLIDLQIAETTPLAPAQD